jgi:mono/diheme cytochrome c family protein
VCLSVACIVGLAMLKNAWSIHPLAPQEQIATTAQAEFFESQIRPILLEKCFECHASDTDQSGGLSLDSSDSIWKGGDSGPAILRNDLSTSLLLRAIEYRDPKLQMPPSGKLSESQIQALQRWVADGAPTPPSFQSKSATGKATTALSVSAAQEHWAYRPLQSNALPTPTSSNHPIDSWLNVYHQQHQLTPSPLVSDRVWARRLAIDLHGLNPTWDNLQSLESALPRGASHTDGLANANASATTIVSAAMDAEALRLTREASVDALLASPRFGERFARKWMDVVRYAESLTLRGFILPDAWRYRNYLIDAYNSDLPFDQMLVQQLAGDLLPDTDTPSSQRHWIATTCLAIGDHNYEEQDKLQLEMDAIDEQLDTIGKAFLAQTLNCARCHDHKFDPIPTRDYYALAGILKSSVSMEHENVSKWIRMPLPIPEQERHRYEQASLRKAAIKKELDAAKKALGEKPKDNMPTKASDFPGIVVDDLAARKVGAWQPSSFTKDFVDKGYLHDLNQDQGSKSVTFEPMGLATGSYLVRMSYAADPNRSSRTLVRVFSADGESEMLINQRQRPEDDGLWQPLGKYRFEQGGQAFVIVSNEGANGHVIVDAVQFVPEGQSPSPSLPNPTRPTSATAEHPSGTLESQIKQLELESAEVQRLLDTRPMVQTVRASNQPSDIPIHIRGSVHRLGSMAPRGFLSCIDEHHAELASRYHIAPQANGRLELARWLADPENPLTARVYVNRVWAWLMGQGLVRTVDNFGTTGESPSCPELLDYLTSQFIAHGWSTKWLVKTIVTSDAYRRSVHASPDAMENDPENHYHTRGILRRLDAESLRDSLLQSSGELRWNQPLGSTVRNGTKEDFRYQHEVGLRSVYLPWFRNSLPELIREFDGANPSFSISQRNRSTVATQALVFMNSPWIRERAKTLATHIEKISLESHSDAVVTSFQLVLGRTPDPTELDWATRLREQSTLEELIHQLMASIDFRYCE